MNFTGRFSVTVFALVCYFFWAANYDFREILALHHMVSAIFFTCVAWWLGKQYDKANYYNKELDKTNKEIEALFDNSDSFLFSNDLLNKRITVSKGIEELLGYSTKDFTDNYELWDDMIDTADNEVMLSFYQELLSGHSSKCEIRLAGRGGETKWFEVIGSAVVDEKGQIVKLIGVASDITAEKLYEKQLQQAAHNDFLTGLPNRLHLSQVKGQ